MAPVWLLVALALVAGAVTSAVVARSVRSELGRLRGSGRRLSRLAPELSDLSARLGSRRGT